MNPVDLLAHSTVRIECEFADGTVGTGTGFFFSMRKNETKHVPVIVTNRHVVDGATVGRFIVTLQAADGSPALGNLQGFELGEFQANWRFHPDPTIDLCAMPLAPLFRIMEEQGKKPFFVTLDETLLPTQQEIDDLIGLEQIVMVGYPNGLWDMTHNLPIFRRGILASDYRRDWNGRPEFLIDAACFPGSSGSPVFLLDLFGYATRMAHFPWASRHKLLGVLYAGPQHTVEGDVKIITVPTRQRVVAEAGIPNNLGIVIKSNKVLDLRPFFD